MTNYAMKWVALMLAIGAGGCFSIKIGDPTASYSSEIGSYTQCTAKTVTGITPVLTKDSTFARYHLELLATGDFVIHDLKKIKTKSGLTRRLYFGILPGLHQEGPYRSMAEMQDEQSVVWIGYLCVITEVGIVFPTAYALLIEPFGEYHAHRGFATCALLGFSKRLLDEGEMTESIDFKETGRSYSSSTAKLYGYSLEIEGRTYNGSSGNVEIGTMDFGYGTPLQRGRRL